MNEPPNLRQLVLAYRLGELSPEDREDFEMRTEQDENFWDRVQQAEFDLIDEYRAGRLSPDERRRMEEAFAPDQLTPLPPLSASAAGANPSLEEPTATRHKATREPSPAWRYWARLAAATAGLILLAAAIWIAFRYIQPREAMPKSAKAPAALTSSAISETPGGTSPTAVLLLAPALTRDSLAAELHLHPALQSVLVQWVVPPQVKARSFELRIRHQGRLLTTMRQSTPLMPVAGSRMAEFRLNVRLFAGAAGHPDYILTIRATEHPREVLGHYAIRVSPD